MYNKGLCFEPSKFGGLLRIQWKLCNNNNLTRMHLQKTKITQLLESWLQRGYNYNCKSKSKTASAHNVHLKATRV
ncbi:hypothetical protein LguiA_029762 [Lonicera macranthoides]